MPTAIHCTRKSLRKVRRNWQSFCKSFIDQLNPMLMAAAFEGGIEPGFDDLDGGFDADHSLTERNHVGIVVTPGQRGGFDVPAQRATNAFDAIGDDGFTIAGAAEHDATLELTARDTFGDGSDEQRIINGRIGSGAKIFDLMPEADQVVPDLFFVTKSRVI